MTARDDLIECLLQGGFWPKDANPLIDAFAHHLAEIIRGDMERQAAGGQYDMGMKRAMFLIDPEMTP